MELEWIESDPQAFADSRAFTREWWQPAPYDDEGTTYFRIRRNGVEVARLKLSERAGGSAYLGVPDLSDALEVVFVEVAASSRRRGVGRQVVATLCKKTDRLIVAFSRDADVDKFWCAVGWARHEHRTRTAHQRGLFLRP